MSIDVWFHMISNTHFLAPLESQAKTSWKVPGPWPAGHPLTPITCISVFWSFLSNLGFPDGSLVKNPPAMQDTRVWSLDQEDPLEKGMATHSSILVWRIPWREEPSGLQSMGLQRVRHNWVTNAFTFMERNNKHWFTKILSDWGWSRFPFSQILTLGQGLRCKKFGRWFKVVLVVKWTDKKEIWIVNMMYIRKQVA